MDKKFAIPDTKMRVITLTIMCALCMAIAPKVSAQVSRVALESKHSRDCYVNVYESGFVDVPPQFPGDERGLMNYINQTRKYPYDAYKSKIQGRVVCSFIVDTDGSICNISVLRGVCPSIDREAVRIIKEMPAWKPGKLNGEDVPVHCIIPVAFRL